MQYNVKRITKHRKPHQITSQSVIQYEGNFPLDFTDE